MKLYVKVRMRAEFIYDLLLFHTYSKLSGFLVNLLGLSVIIAGGFLLKSHKIELYQALFYLAAGLLVLCFTPLSLKMQAKRMMRQTRYRSDILYGFDGDGIEERLGEAVAAYPWAEVRKAISTPKNIAFYIGEDKALILPKESFGDRFMPVMKLIAEHVSRDRIYIR